MRRAALAAAVSLIAALLLAGCQPAGPEAAAGAPTAPAMAVEDIAVTPLDPPADPPSAPPADPPPAPQAAPAEAAPPPAAAKSPQQLACERGGGRYVAAGASGARACVRPTRDAGKRCRREGDCDGLCLARSQSCAPVKPLFGCNDILQADGRRVTLCVD